MEKENTTPLVLFLFHRAVGHAYGALVRAAKLGMVTDLDIRLIEKASIEMIDEKISVPDSLARLDDGSAADDATLLTTEFFKGVNATAGNPLAH